MTVVPGTTYGVLPGIGGRGSHNVNPGVNGGVTADYAHRTMQVPRQ